MATPLDNGRVVCDALQHLALSQETRSDRCTWILQCLQALREADLFITLAKELDGENTSAIEAVMAAVALLHAVMTACPTADLRTMLVMQQSMDAIRDEQVTRLQHEYNTRLFFMEYDAFRQAVAVEIAAPKPSGSVRQQLRLLSHGLKEGASALLVVATVDAQRLAATLNFVSLVPDMLPVN
jgi:hypothetical protein